MAIRTKGYEILRGISLVQTKRERKYVVKFDISHCERRAISLVEVEITNLARVAPVLKSGASSLLRSLV
jgi:hypothetical protein